MIYGVEHNDVVMNFYRAKVYRFDKNNMQHYKDAGRCRYATFEERERFLKLDKEIAGINEVLDLTVRNRSKWDKKAVPEIKINISDKTLSDFIKLANKLDIYDFSELIREMFNIINGKTDKMNKKDIRNLKIQYNKQIKILRMFKNELENLEL